MHEIVKKNDVSMIKSTKEIKIKNVEIKSNKCIKEVDFETKIAKLWNKLPHITNLVYFVINNTIMKFENKLIQTHNILKYKKYLNMKALIKGPSTTEKYF